MNKPEHSIFVGRNEELQELMELARQAFAGKSGVVFVTGEAGIGKTYLVEEFFGRLRKEYTSVVIASGQCSIQSASYLPFHAILEDLLESQKQVTVSGKKLRQVAEVVVDTIWNVGPDLIGVFGIPIKVLQTIADKLGLRGKKSATALEIPKDLDQVKIFGWYTKVMKDIAAQVPLVLFLDDLHWADDSSLNLLLHLGRELENQRLLVIGSYRPHEVTPNSLLMQVKTKLGRYGAREVALDVAETTPQELTKRQQFVDAYLMARYGTNFSDTFLQVLADRTEGNALFLTEMLKNLEEKGQITPGDAKDSWQLTTAIKHLADLPEKVENAISERVNRLEIALREILDYASVEGDDFIAQVIARVRQLDEWQLIDDLTEKLMKIHQLIYERGEKPLASGQYVDEFVFKHNLIREHLYANLPQSKKRRIHARIGECLEDLYSPNPEEIASQLAVHFSHAYVLDKAVYYCLKAAEDANRRYGASEAVRFGRMGLEAIEQQKNILSQDEYGEKKVRFLLELAKAEEFGGNSQEEKDHIQAGIDSLENELSRLDILPDTLCAEVYFQLGILYSKKWSSKSQKRQQYLEKALAIYERYNHQKHMAELLYYLANVYQHSSAYYEEQERFDKIIGTLTRSVTIAEQLQDVELQSKCLSYLVVLYLRSGKNFSYAEQLAQKALKITRTSKKSNYYAMIKALCSMADICNEKVEHKTGTQYLEEALKLSGQIGDVFLESWVLHDLGRHYSYDVTLQEKAQKALEHSLSIKERVGLQRNIQFNTLGQVFAKHGKWTQAKKSFQNALVGASEISQSYYRLDIGQLYILQGKYAQAEREFLAILEVRKKYKWELSLEGYIMIALNYGLLGDRGQCKKYMEFAQTLSRQDTRPRYKWGYLYILAEIRRVLQEFELAKSACQHSLNWFLNNAEAPEDLVYVAEARLIMGKILVDTGEYREAITYLDKARAAFEVCEHYALGETLLYLGKAYQSLGGTVFLHDAKTYINQALAEFQRLELAHKAQEAQEVLRSLA